MVAVRKPFGVDRSIVIIADNPAVHEIGLPPASRSGFIGRQIVILKHAKRKKSSTPPRALERSKLILVIMLCAECSMFVVSFSLDHRRASTSPGIATCKIHDGVQENRME